MQNYILKEVRAAAVLTGSYVAGTVIGIDEVHADLNNQLVLYVDFTIGSLDSASIKVEFSTDNSDYYQESSESLSAGVGTVSALTHLMDATGKYRIPIPVKDRFIKISAIGTGTVDDSSLKINAVIGVA